MYCTTLWVMTNLDFVYVHALAWLLPFIYPFLLGLAVVTAITTTFGFSAPSALFLRLLRSFGPLFSLSGSHIRSVLSSYPACSDFFSPEIVNYALSVSDLLPHPKLHWMQIWLHPLLRCNLIVVY